MKCNLARTMLVLSTMCALTMVPLQAEASHCSVAVTAGNWAYTYTGTIFTPNGPVPAASVGHFAQDASGNVTGSQTRSVAGTSGEEDIAGNITVNKDCTSSGTIAVFVNGQLQRTAVIALVYDSNMNHVRLIFQSLTLPDGTNVPVVISGDSNRISGKD
jgi:hypothetical protein